MEEVSSLISTSLVDFFPDHVALSSFKYPYNGALMEGGGLKQGPRPPQVCQSNAYCNKDLTLT